MMYLSVKTPLFCDANGNTYEHDEVYYDDVGDVMNLHDEPVDPVGSRKAKWWAVAVYDVYQAYGGPEEGGWYYDCGDLIEHARIRFFDSYEDACAYQDELYEAGLQPMGLTEEMPPVHYPKHQPIYC